MARWIILILLLLAGCMPRCNIEEIELTLHPDGSMFYHWYPNKHCAELYPELRGVDEVFIYIDGIKDDLYK